MKTYQSAGKLKAAFFLLGVLLILVALVYTQTLVNRLRDDAREFLNFYADIYAEEATDFESTDYTFFFEEIMQQINFPIIISSEKESGPNAWRNIDIPYENIDSQVIRRVTERMQEMDESNEPIPLMFEDITLGYIHYGDSQIIRELQWLPYIEIIVVALFIFIGFIGYQTIRKSEQRLIWVGMARETAHQLGTPISSLLGWTTLLKERNFANNSKDIIENMEQDIHRLEQVASRFSEISGKEHFVVTNLGEIIDKVVNYLERRLPQTDKNIQLMVEGDVNIKLPLNPDLMEWALENLIKNGIDAIEQESGKIKLVINKKENNVLTIDVVDTGRGIENQQDWKRVFKPGYSTKRRRWGLGLSLTKRIVEEYHSGSLEIVRSAPGKGTTLRITLFVKKLKS